MIPIAILTIDKATGLPFAKFIKPFNFNPKNLQKDVILYMKAKDDK
jgi:hypothetical protein